MVSYTGANRRTVVWVEQSYQWLIAIEAGNVPDDRICRPGTVQMTGLVGQELFQTTRIVGRMMKSRGTESSINDAELQLS